MKTKYIHFGLLAVAAVVVLWYLMRNKSAAAAAPAAAPGTVPAVAPAEIKLGDVNIGYNQPPLINYGAEVGDGPNSACDCGAAGQPVSFPRVAPTIFQSSVDNFNSFVAKNGFSAPSSVVPGTQTPAHPLAPPAPKQPAHGVIFSEVA